MSLFRSEDLIGIGASDEEGLKSKLMGAVLTIVSTVILGVAVQTNWNWFVAPLGAPQVEFWQSLGIATLVGYLSYHQVKEEHSVLEAGIHALVKGVLLLAFSWLYAWLGGYI